MTSEVSDRRARAITAFSFLSPKIQEALLSDTSFVQRYDLKLDANISVSGGGPSLRRSHLFAATRHLVPPATTSEVSDLDGNSCRLSLSDGAAGVSIELHRQQARYGLPDLWSLLPDIQLRLRAFDAAAHEANLPSEVKDRWRAALSTRALSDDDAMRLHDDLDNTPVRFAKRLTMQFSTGHVEAPALVPDSEEYFDRLIGPGVQKSILEQVQINVREHIEQLIHWNPVDGFLLAVLLGSHSSICAQVPSTLLSDVNLSAAYDALLKADRLSQLAGLEIGLSVLAERAAIRRQILKLATILRDDDATLPASEYTLLSSLFSLVESELVRTRRLSTRPPFLRRLASLAQAALIARCALTAPALSIERFSAWAREVGQGRFYLRALCDLRTEPRWLPEFSAAHQLKNEFLGRAVIAAEQNATRLSSEVRAMVLDDLPDSLRNQMDLIEALLPGPLEGALSSPADPPAALVAEIERRLTLEVLDANSFTLLVNVALIFRINLNHVELAAKGLRSANYYLRSVEERPNLYSLVSGLAHVAAVARSVDLASQVRILVRRCRFDSPQYFTVVTSLPIGLIAAAANLDTAGWCQWVGDWATELAFACEQRGEAEDLYVTLQLLCHAMPDLWAYCGRAEAALTALLEK